jgi:peptidoglycan/xylan/chitin deacetylase (PgdA/CDA1 family)
MYHACEGAESDFTRGLSINTTPARFAAQLDFLQKYYRVVPLESLGGDAQPDRAVVITFDDGFRSVYEHVLPILRARNLPATCYLVTDRIDNNSAIWINELNWFLRRHRAVAKDLVAHRLGHPPLLFDGSLAPGDHRPVRSRVNRRSPGGTADEPGTGGSAPRRNGPDLHRQA